MSLPPSLYVLRGALDDVEAQIAKRDAEIVRLNAECERLAKEADDLRDQLFAINTDKE